MKNQPYATGKTSRGEEIEGFTLASDSGVVAKVMSYGATLVWLETPDRHGDHENIVLAHPDLAAYEQGTHYLGATVGRYANRIAGGGFSLDGVRHSLTRNERGHHLHGGASGFGKRVWQPRPFATSERVGVEFAYTSPDGEEGYPGALQSLTTYSLAPDGELSVEYSCSTDRPTHVNLTNHAYFNLAGHASGTILEHELLLDCDRFLTVDAQLIPTGQILPVEGTAMDFRQAKPLGRDIAARGQGHGELYDVCLVARPAGRGLRPLARLFHPGTGRLMQVLTTQPAVQLYTGNHFNGVAGVAGAVYQRHQGVALETQHYPDSPNHPEFPNTVLRPGGIYLEKTVYRFSVV